MRDGFAQGWVRAACSHIPSVGLHSCVVVQPTIPVTQSIVLLFVYDKGSLATLVIVSTVIFCSDLGGAGFASD